MFLANFIRLFHVAIILFVLITPFTKIVPLLLLHTTFSLVLLVHWMANNDICSLSLIEAKLRGIKYTESFLHQFISPLYNISEKSWSRICYITVSILGFISFYKFIKSDTYKTALSCFKQYKNLQCLIPLFVIQ